MPTATASGKECRSLPKLEEVFCNFSPDASVVMMMLVILMERMVEKGYLTKDEVADISVKASEVMAEVAQNFA